MSTPPKQSRQMVVPSVIKGINVLVASGYSIAGLVSPQVILPAGAVTTQASVVFAMYAAVTRPPKTDPGDELE